MLAPRERSRVHLHDLGKTHARTQCQSNPQCPSQYTQPMGDSGRGTDRLRGGQYGVGTYILADPTQVARLFRAALSRDRHRLALVVAVDDQVRVVARLPQPRQQVEDMRVVVEQRPFLHVRVKLRPCGADTHPIGV